MHQQFLVIMNTDLELIHRLVLEELAGVISDNDLAYLKKTIREDPEAFNVWMETRSILNTPDVKAFLERPRSVDAIFNETMRPKKNGYWGFSLSVIAILIVSFLFFQYFHPTTQKVQHVAQTINAKNIRLDLPDDGTIDLSTQQGAVNLNTVKLTNSNKSLTFESNSTTARLACLSVPAGKDYKITLPDGTSIWLNAATTLRFPLNFVDNTRDIYLNGEAYLEVAESKKPFIVHLPDASIQVLGTAFNVNTYTPNKMSVALVKGTIKMEIGQDSVQLSPGHQIVYQPQTGMVVSNFDAKNLLSWRQGKYSFENTPLSEILQVLPRWFGKDLVFDNPTSPNTRFTGILNSNEPIEYSLNLLKSTNAMDYYITGDTIHIK